MLSKDREAWRHVSGRGTFIDDISFPHMLECVFVRSTYPHAWIRGIQHPPASACQAVLTWRELEKYAKPLKLVYPFKNCNPMVLNFLAHDKVRYVGEPVAAVIAGDKYKAHDLAESVNVEYEPLPAVSDPLQSIESDILLYDEWRSNLLARFTQSYGDLDKAYESSRTVVEEKFYVNRQTAAPLETRGCIAYYDHGKNFLTIWVSNQNPHLHRAVLSEVLSIPENRIRVIVPDVGGAFGQKGHTYPEDVVVAAASMLTGRPVKWIETRRENLTSSAHSREQVHFIKMGCTADGIITFIKDEAFLDVGAHLLYPHDYLELAHVVMDMITGPYKIQNYSVAVNCVVTNKTPSGAYRGFGHPEATFVRERMLDILADECGLEPSELRLRNLISSQDIPYTGPTGLRFDSGDPRHTFEKTLEIAAKQLAASESKLVPNKVVGVGFSVSIKGSVPSMMGVTQRWGSSEAAAVRINPDGKVVVYSGAVSMGTRLGLLLSEVVARTLGVNPEDVEAFLGDTQATPFSTGLWGSRGAVMCGGAAACASEKLKRKILQMTSHLLECSVKDLEIRDGRVFVKDNSGRSLSLAEIAAKAYNEPYLFPEEMDVVLEAAAVYDPPNISRKPDDKGRMNAVAAVSTAAVAAFVELDIETLAVKPLKVLFVENGGFYIDSATVDDQLIGGIVQGLGGALYEEIVYRDGNPQTTTFADYLIPASAEVPPIELEHLTDPSPFTFMGLKGVGETGTIPVMAAVSNAVQEALQKAGLRTVVRESSLSPYKVWRMVKS
ncbi:MAG: xanthine dehydrogenase family protein molybdopterin-binding subunit [Candidatus Caldarchaeum sp.]